MNCIFFIKSCTALTEKEIIIIICKINWQWQMIPGTVVLFLKDTGDILTVKERGKEIL
jgi:hypothetical protein|tara:strand:- start:35198 stop:35371 length:174 start_codon:yes stop_codon:yes gene_type:complete